MPPATPPRPGAGATTGDDTPDSPPVRVVDRRWWAVDAEASSDGAPASLRPAYVDELERRLGEADARLAEVNRQHARAVQEFDETRERLRRSVAQQVDRATHEVLASFLDVVDNLTRAIEAATSLETGDSRAAVVDGIRLVRTQFLAALERHGVAPIEAEGHPFDPRVHEALSTVAVDDPALDNVVVSVLAPGYRVHDDVLRPARVTVGQRSDVR